MFEPVSKSELIEQAATATFWSIGGASVTPFDPAKPYICVGGSSAYMSGIEQIPELTKSYRHLCERLGEIAQVVLTVSSQPDDRILGPVAEQLGLPIFGFATPSQQAVDILGNAAAYVGGRWHPGIMALTGGTPLVSFSANSDFKSKGLVEMVGLDQPAFSAWEIDASLEAIVALTKQRIEEGDALRQRLLISVRELRSTCQKQVELMRS